MLFSVFLSRKWEFDEKEVFTPTQRPLVNFLPDKDERNEYEENVDRVVVFLDIGFTDLGNNHGT